MPGADLRQRLAGRPALLLDGGLGSLLIARGLEPGRAPEWWLIERPEEIAAVHRGYVEAGSDIVHTATFGASPPRLADAGLAGRCRELNTLAVEIAARAAAGHDVLVAGDIGPTSRYLPPLGTATEDDLAAAFAEQVEALAAAGADLLSIETMFDLREAQIALAAARASGLPVIASMTFESRPRGTFTVMGDAAGPALNALAGAGAAAVGMNCSVTSAVMLEMVKQVRPALPPEVLLAAQPNAGAPRPAPTGVVYDAQPEPFARDLAQMVAAGAQIVGGCCGTDPDFIRAAGALLSAAGTPLGEAEGTGGEDEQD